MHIVCCGETLTLRDGKAACPKCRAVHEVKTTLPKPKPEKNYNIWIGCGFLVTVVLVLWLASCVANWGL